MSKDIDSIKRKLLIKYPNFGSTISRLEFIEDEQIGTASTNGKAIFYNPKFLESLSEKQKIFLFAHEVCHVEFDHIFRREGKEKILWNIATDAVINALLKQDGLEMIEGGINIPEAENFNAEDMYEKLLEERRKQQKSLKDNNEKQNNSNIQKGNGEEQKNKENQNVGHDSHDLWDKAIEERKQEEVIGEINKSEKVDEKEEIEENREERKRRLKDFSRELVNRSKWKTKF